MFKFVSKKIDQERRQLKAEKQKLEQERELLNRQNEKSTQSTLPPKPISDNAKGNPQQESPRSNQDSSASPPSQDTQSREERLLEQMKQRYQQQLKRRQEKNQSRDPRIPEIEVDPLSLWYDSPSQGALPLTIARYRVILEELE